jgi:signal transduction histidine kinase/DNA-binding response OmpR family regulator
MEAQTKEPVLDVNAAMRAAIDAYDWASTPLGPKASWPRALRTLLSMVLDTPFAMLIMWGDDLIQIYNQGYVPIFGDKHPKSLGQPAAECWEHIWDEVGPLLRGVYERGEAVYFENLLLPMARNGGIEDAYFTFSYSPIREGDRILGLICVVAETTAHVLREREIAERAEALAQLDRAKTNFFNNVSHEFRTPLTLMLGPLEDLVRTLPDYEQRERADLARRNAIRLQKLVNMLLDFSSAQSGVTRAHREYVDLGELTADLASEFRSAFERAGLTLEIEGASRCLVPVDRTMYEKVVLNLLSNALKFTFEGGVIVSMERDDAHFVLRVRDTGVGIAQEDIQRLFQRFSRVQGARSRTHEGSGIGLALVHELVGLHGGTIEVESAPGKGSCFTVRLPLHAATESTAVRVDTSTLRREFLQEAYGFTPAARAPSVSSAPKDAARVLIADDNADLRTYLGRLLGSRYQVAFANDGEELVQYARTSAPDIIIADVMMPRLDGFAALEALRTDPATASIPLILLSARAGEDAAADGLARGADDYIIKPFVAADLMARVDALLRRTGSTLAPSIVRAQREAAILSAAADRFIAASDTAMVWKASSARSRPAFRIGVTSSRRTKTACCRR